MADIDLHQGLPHTARMYDYYLGGKTYYEADRVKAEEVLSVYPGAGIFARTNRDFMHRATRWLAEQGIRQFLDIGTGIPTEPNLHQVAQDVAPDARVVYVDNDPIVLTYARALLSGTPEGRTEYLDADVTHPASILDAPELKAVLNLSQPVALSLIALLHFVPDEAGATDIVRTLVDALAPGSYVVLTHVTPDFAPESIKPAVQMYKDVGLPVQVRSRDEFARFFEGLELLDPGIVSAHRWRPAVASTLGTGVQRRDAEASLYAAVGRKD